MEPITKMQITNNLERATRQYLINSGPWRQTVCLGMICLWHGFIHDLGTCVQADSMSQSASLESGLAVLSALKSAHLYSLEAWQMAPLL